MSDFVHLHVHGQSSLLDGLIRAQDAARAAAADGQRAIALTDHGSIAGTYAAARAAADAGLTFIPGEEIYLAIGSRFANDSVLVPADCAADDGDAAGEGIKRKKYEHLTVLARDAAGWENLQRLDLAARHTVYGKPRADYELLARHAQGVTFLTGCLGGPVAGPLRVGDVATAQANLSRLVDIAGRDHVFVEVMDHGTRDDALVDIAARFGLPVVATNDAHYTGACDAQAHDAWLASGTRARLSDAKRFRFHGSGYHLRTAVEMHDIFDDQPGTETAVANSLLVAEQVQPGIIPVGVAEGAHLPTYVPPDGTDLKAYFYRPVREGAVARYGSPQLTQVKDRLRFEVDVIDGVHMAAYCLIIADAIADERAAGGLVGYGRGSGAGSVVLYCLGVTNVDPLRYGLLFERFLNPDRAGLPDVDTDFQAGRQWEANERVAKQ